MMNRIAIFLTEQISYDFLNTVPFQMIVQKTYLGISFIIHYKA